MNINLNEIERNIIWQALYSKRAELYRGTLDDETKTKINELNALMDKLNII